MAWHAGMQILTFSAWRNVMPAFHGFVVSGGSKLAFAGQTVVCGNGGYGDVINPG